MKNRTWLEDSRFSSILVLLVIITIPLGAYRVLTTPLSINNAVVLLVVSIYSLVLVRMGSFYFSHGQILIIGVLSLLSLQTSISSLKNPYFPSMTITYLGYIFVFFIVSIYSRRHGNVKKVLWFWFISAVIVSHITIFSSIFGFNIGAEFAKPISALGYKLPFRRTLGVNLGYGGYGMFVLGPLGAFLIYSYIKSSFIYSYGCVSIVFSVVFISQSRSSWGALIISLIPILVYFLWNSDLRQIMMSAIIMGSPIILILAHRSLGFIISINNRSLTLRITQYLTAVRKMKQNPLLGYGAGDPDGTGLSYLIHNFFLRTGGSSGTPAFLLIVSLFLIAGTKVIRLAVNANGEEEMLAVGMASGLLAILVELQFSPGISVSAWVLVALIVSPRNSQLRSS